MGEFNMMNRSMLARGAIFAATVAAVATIGMLTSCKAAEARGYRQHHVSSHHVYRRARHHQRHYSRRGGACDGFQRCRCGTTAARHFGLPYAYKGFNLKMASEWARAFPHTSFHIGVAGVKPHHVLAVVGGSDCHSAKVYDDAGTRDRNVCGFTFVEVNGSRVAMR
jgi:hypothetical protein